jgi:peptidoglycan/LPS O-acetylase OafA/YrhL
LFHAGVPAVHGGFVGVDVFFVISGFVITGVLLRERSGTGRTSILSFYGRRARRIIPAATLVIIATVLLSFILLDIGEGAQTARDGSWAAVFLINFHFTAESTNYLASSLAPSPLQNFWSLAVEEQFYLVYPTLFLLVASLRVLSLRARMAIGLVAVIGVSLAYSITNTPENPIGAFFSSFTRAWELALGALVAICTPWLAKLPRSLATVGTWVGLVAVGIAACAFSSKSAYPGSLVIIPVVGAALIIAGGAAAPSFGVERLLHLAPFRWLGKLSYSLYLWHWPILIIAAEYAGKTTLSVKDNLGWLAVALGISVLTYVAIENPVRHSPRLRRNRWASVGLGVGLVSLTLATISISSNLAGANMNLRRHVSERAAQRAPVIPLHSILHDVDVSDRIQRLPDHLNPPLEGLLLNPPGFIGYPGRGCASQKRPKPIASCVFGDLHGSRTLVLYGDSHAGMWFTAIEASAVLAHWKVAVLMEKGCPASLIPVPVGNNTSGDWRECDKWHHSAIQQIRRMHPNLLVVSENAGYYDPTGQPYSTEESKLALERLLSMVPADRKVVIGNPAAPLYGTTDCIAQHISDLQACSGPPNQMYLHFNKVERSAALAAGASFVDVVPWLCTKVCSPVINHDEVYLTGDHISIGYSLRLKGVLAQALQLNANRGRDTHDRHS